MSLLACDRILDVNQGKPLHWAAAMGHLEVVKELLKSKKEVDINAVKYLPLRDEDHKYYYGTYFSPLHLASVFGHGNVVQALCDDTTGRLRATLESSSGIRTL
jgi:ankyrin repeat protein